MSFLTLMVKATRLCNLRCAYCYDWRSGPDQTMAFPVLATLVAKALGAPGVSDVEFAWHGGETTLLPVEFYEKAVALQARFRRPGQRIVNGFQTNGSRLTPDWVAFLREHRFRVGISIDGPAEIHDASRLDRGGGPTLHRVLAGLQLLRDGGIEPSVLMVLDAEVVATGPERLFSFIVEHGLTRVGLLAAKPPPAPDAPRGTPADHYVAPAAANQFLARLYDLWLEHGDPAIRIRELAGIERQVHGQSSGFCTLSGRCFGSFYVIEPTGMVGHCDYFVGDDRYRLGNILSDDFQSIGRSARLAALQAADTAAHQRLRNCPEYGVCRGWCPYERYVSERHNTAHADDCCGLRDLIRHVRRRLDERAERAEGRDVPAHAGG